MDKEQVPVTQEQIREIGLQIGTVTRAISTIVASLDGAGIINGRSVARSIRLDNAGHEELRLSLADLIDRTIEAMETDGPAGPRPIE